MAIEIGKVYPSTESGNFVVLCKDEEASKLYHHTYYKIQFLYTGYEKSVRYDVIKRGNAYDPYFPKICGIGYLGETDDGSTIDMTLFRNWENILQRCYDINSQYYYAYGGKGVTVCPRWHCYANFLKDYPNLPGYKDMISHPEIRYHIDKDILQQNIPDCQKVYSPETCMLVPAYLNSVQVAKDHFHEHDNEYYNVYYRKGKYDVTLQINGMTYRIGRYEDPIVAANAANHARELFGIGILNTNVPYISKEEVNAQNTKSVKKTMVRFIDGK